MKQTPARSQAAHKKRTRYIGIGVAALAILIIGAVLIHRHAANSSQAAKTTASMPTTSSTANSKRTTSGSTINPDPNVPGGSPSGATTQPAELIAPSGTFVSNHSPSLDPNDSRNQEQSVCLTNVGATCEIMFTKNGVTNTLGVKTAGTTKDSQTGVASWPVWSPLSIGLTQGVWQVTATASLNGQTKTAKDQLTVN